MAFFRNFPIVNYKFGDEEDIALFNNITAYIDLIDQISDDASFYTNYVIQDGERPDILSYKLYGTPDFYWMFYLLNAKIRTQGWPLSQSEIIQRAKEYYPNTVLVSNRSMHGEFYIGDICASKDPVRGFQNPDFKARILSKDLDLGQIVVKPIYEVRSITITNAGNGYTSTPTVTISGGGGSGAAAQAILDSDQVGQIIVLTGGDNYTTTPTITISAPDIARGENATATATLSSNTISDNTTIWSQKGQPDPDLWDEDNTDLRSLYVNATRDQWNAVHHYETMDSDGTWVDLPINANGVGVDNITSVGLGGKTPITYLDRLIKQNEELATIKIFKPEVARQIDTEFQKLLRSSK